MVEMIFTHFVDVIPFRKGIKQGIHRVQHRDDVHWTNSATNFREGHDIRKEDRNAIEHL